MAREIIKEAATVEEAKALIVSEFAAAEEQIDFEVMQEAGKKVLGLFGGANAIVKGTLRGTAAEIAKAYLEKVLAAMGVTDFTCTVKEENNGCVISLDGENLGFIIGRRGDTLDALQYLTGLVANRVDNAYYRVTLDIGNYREKREQALVALARRLAGQTARTGRRHSLEPMNPYERRIIHTAVQKVEGATSWSVGKEPSRHVIIGPSDDNPMKNHPQGGRDDRRKGGRGDRRGGQRSGESAAKREKRSDPYTITYKPREVRAFVSRQNPMKDADGATPPEKTFSTVENSDVKLYGRIDL
jgi:spoIIIJ-associated protein